MARFTKTGNNALLQYHFPFIISLAYCNAMPSLKTIIFLEPTFRGCADATYNHEHKCTSELQAVTVVDNEKHVDVKVELCYCGDEKCNQQRNEAYCPFQTSKINVTILVSLAIIWFATK